jgi:hypothetical protein
MQVVYLNSCKLWSFVCNRSLTILSLLCYYEVLGNSAVKWFSLILSRNSRVVTSGFNYPNTFAVFFLFHPRIQKFAFLSSTFQGACYFFESDIELMLGAKHFVKVQRFIFKVNPRKVNVWTSGLSNCNLRANFANASTIQNFCNFGEYLLSPNSQCCVEVQCDENRYSP